jgi:hypothetical protein
MRSSQPLHRRPALRLALAAAAALASARASATDPAAEEALRRGAIEFATLERAEAAKLSKVLDALASDPVLVKAFRARDRKALLAAAAPKFERLREKQHVTHWYFLDPPPARTCFLRVHAPQLHGDVVTRDTFAQAIAFQRVAWGKELGKTAFALRVVKPVRADGKVVGYMELGEEIDDFLVRIKERTGDDFGLLIDKDRIDRKELARVLKEDHWDERPEVVLIDSTMWNDRMIQLGVAVERLPEEGLMLGTWTDGARTFDAAAFPVRDASGRIVGALVVRHASAAR